MSSTISTNTSDCVVAAAAHRDRGRGGCRQRQLLVQTPSSGTVVISLPNNSTSISYDDLLSSIVQKAAASNKRKKSGSNDDVIGNNKRRRLLLSQNAYLVCGGKILSSKDGAAVFRRQLTNNNTPISIQFKLRIRGGIDRQNRVGSKFGGGGVSSGQQSERERKERLKQLALESIDLAKDPYLIRNHLGSYECKLCLTLHRDESNYLAHTQGKKHQKGKHERR